MDITARTLLATLGAASVAVAQPGAGIVADHATIYTASNSTEGNEILVFEMGPNGTLTRAGSFPTGGFGTGAGLGNQGGVVFSADGQYLLCVNAGSNDVSVFSVRDDSLVLTDLEASLGELPVSIAVDGDLVYVLNGAGPGSIQGFDFFNGDLTPIANSMRPLSGARMTGAAQVGFTPDGSTLVVTEKATSLIDTYALFNDGTSDGPFTFRSSGITPFGFDFSQQGDLLVSEAFGGEENASAASSYMVGADASLNVITPSAPTTETAACWLVVSPNGAYAYTTNTGSGTVTGFNVDGRTGMIKRFDRDGVTGVTGKGSMPIDAAFAPSGFFLFTLDSGTHAITVFRADTHSGDLVQASALPGLPEGANGLAAR